MDAATNPFSPGAGLRPAALVGREIELDRWAVALRRVAAQRSARSVVLQGLRGVGKTVLLGEYRRMATKHRWVTALVEGGTGQPLRTALVQALHPELTRLARPTAPAQVKRALATFSNFSVKVDTQGTWSFGLDLSNEPGSGGGTGNLELDLAQVGRDLSEAAAGEGSGLALLIDEAQDLSGDELTALCALAHQAGQREWPLLIGLAGLPSLPGVLAEAKSYAERLFTYHDIGKLGPVAARAALIEPAAQEGVTWDTAAIDLIVAQTAGYPYFLQEYGQATWNAEDDPRQLTLTAARIGAAQGQAHLDTGFYRARWERATPQQRDYLAAMAADGAGPSQSSEVAARLDRTPTKLGPARDALIKKGLIYAPEHGKIAFTVPRMAEFIARQTT